MDNRANHALSDDFAAALDWWRDAGVDCTFHDEPANWIAPPEEAKEAIATAPVPEATERPRHFAPLPVPDIDLSGIPDDLAGFSEWWMKEPALDDGRLGGRVPPRGVAGADLMVLVPEPEAEDSDQLLSGSQGRLLQAMLEAMEIGPDRAYLASALPRHTPMADWQAKVDAGYGAVVRRHVILARPKRLLVFGTNILPLIDNDPAQGPAVLRNFNHEGMSIPMLVTRGLPALLERPRWKGIVWQAWLDWTA
ncbi:MAG: hypothetical protein KDE55_18845 [Novosphingobium sp.]|nr:hypothetical protein [Novosphingobium sp.]